MNYRPLGRTGLLVSEVCLGTMTFHGGTGMYREVGTLDQAQAERLVATAWEAGVNLFDTADVYSEGESEKMLGRAIRNLGLPRGEVVVATKVFGRTGPGPNQVGASRSHILRSVEDSLVRLQTDYIDLYQIHGHDTLTPLDETLGALDALIAQGKVRYAGCSNWPAWRLAQAHGVSQARGLARLESVQAYYSLAGRDLEREVIPHLRSDPTALLVWAPLAGGLLSGKFSRDQPRPADSRRAGSDFPPVDRERLWRILDVVAALARERGCSAAQICLAWLLAQPAVTSVIVGAKRAEQLADNLGATALVLGSAEREALDRASALPPEYPGWMMGFQDAGRRPRAPEGR